MYMNMFVSELVKGWRGDNELSCDTRQELFKNYVGTPEFKLARKTNFKLRYETLLSFQRLITGLEREET